MSLLVGSIIKSKSNSGSVSSLESTTGDVNKKLPMGGKSMFSRIYFSVTPSSGISEKLELREDKKS